jgi:hypothetical protein
MAFPTISYTRETALGYPGMIATTEPEWITSLVVGATSGAVIPGQAVVVDTLGGTAKAPTAGGAFAGVVVADRTLPTSQGNNFGAFDQFSSMRGGSIWVNAPVAVAQGDPVYFINATGVLTNVSAGGTLITGAEWVHPTTGAGLSRIRLAVSK